MWENSVRLLLATRNVITMESVKKMELVFVTLDGVALLAKSKHAHNLTEKTAMVTVNVLDILVYVKKTGLENTATLRFVKLIVMISNIFGHLKGSMSSRKVLLQSKLDRRTLQFTNMC